MLKLPIFLDSIGTLISAVLLGPFIGMLTGLQPTLWGLNTDPIAAAFAPVAMVYRSGRRVAGARRLVVPCPKCGRQRRRHYVSGDAGRRTASYRAFGGALPWRR